MSRDSTEISKFIKGVNGSVPSLANLPSPDTRRWMARAKAEIVAAVKGGVLTLDEACETYSLTVEEFLAWKHAVDRFGLEGLRATRSQEYRKMEIQQMESRQKEVLQTNPRNRPSA